MTNGKVDAVLEDKVNAVYEALINSLEKIKKHSVGRVILTLFEVGEEELKEEGLLPLGRWISEKDIMYYPFEMLNEAEQEMIKSKKSYKVIALVSDRIPGIITYPAPGVEVYVRMRIDPYLPRLKKKSPLNYITKGGIYPIGKELKNFAEKAVTWGWKPEDIEKVVEMGIQEYHSITKKLMEEAGVYKCLEKMQKRKRTPFEEVLPITLFYLNK